ncbi:hypothetical protein PI124_g11684 [Phytophthora idaei]|nr:hypothetical protein PI124_g11684 [Phytophthora idaei]
MAYIMDFNSVWPLLRKEGWTWKPATSIQIHHNYLKPGRKVRVAIAVQTTSTARTNC